MEVLTKNPIVEIVEESGLEVQTKNTLIDNFIPFFQQASEWKKKAESLIITDETQIREMRMAREARLALKEIRVNADKTRKALKEDSLKYGRAVQSVYNLIEYMIAPIEDHLEKQEKFIEIKEIKRIDSLRAARELEAESMREFIPYGIDFGLLIDEDYQKIIDGARLQIQRREQEKVKAEQERIEAERKLAEERASMLAENERLKKEAAEKEKAMKAEREKAEADRKKIEAERERALKEARRIAEEKAKIEAEIKAKAIAEERVKKEADAKEAAERKAKEAAERKALRAPDKVKIIEFSNSLLSITYPEVKSVEAKLIRDWVRGEIKKLSGQCVSKAEQL